MKIRKVLVICGLLISVTASTFNVSVLEQLLLLKLQEHLR